MAKFISRFGTCIVCDSNPAKYCCPGCEIKTCSLPCVKIHKKELNCDGIRNRVAYKNIRNMTNLDLQSDYMLLEEITREVGNSTRTNNPCKQFTRINKPLPLHLQKLCGGAYKRGTHLHILPGNFSDHRRNTTYFNWKEDVIYWRVDWIFIQANNFKISSERFNENDQLSAKIHEIIEENEKHLVFYKSQSSSAMQILLKAEKKPNGSVYRLDPSETLKENLKGKTLIEYPMIYVILKDFLGDINVIESDDEFEGKNPKKRKLDEKETNFFEYNSSDENEENSKK